MVAFPKLYSLVFLLVVMAGHPTFGLTESQFREIIRSELANVAWGNCESRIGKYPSTPKTLTSDEFYAIVDSKPDVWLGRSYNGSSANEIQETVSRFGYKERSTTVLFYNHLDQAINNFQIYEHNITAFHPAPVSIPPHTVEIFTFAEPSWGYVRNAFSYNIPGYNVRIASAFNIESGTDDFALAFVPASTSMMDYYFGTDTGIPGSSQKKVEDAVNFTGLIVGYQDLYAKILVGADENNNVTVYIDLVDTKNYDVVPSQVVTQRPNYYGNDYSTPETVVSASFSSQYAWPTSTPYSPAPQSLSWEELDVVFSNKPILQTGRSFNGSDAYEIASTMSRFGYEGKSTTVVVVNHLDRAINNFQIYERNISAYHRAPTSIPPHTMEIFTFAEPSCCYVRNAFSYNIPGYNVRIAAALNIEPTDQLSLAFLQTGTSMMDYYVNPRIGIPSYVIKKDAVESPRLIVRYGSYLYARMYATAKGNNKVVVGIEITDTLK